MSDTLCDSSANDLCSAQAALVWKLATTTCHHVDALIVCRLIPLVKKPECRPIGIREVIQCVVGKCIMAVVKDYARRAAVNLKVCAGLHAGEEATIHALREILNEENCTAVLLVDGRNAFNTVSRKTVLDNTEVKCPSLTKYVENTYSEPSNLYMNSNRGSNNDHVLQAVVGDNRR